MCRELSGLRGSGGSCSGWGGNWPSLGRPFPEEGTRPSDAKGTRSAELPEGGRARQNLGPLRGVRQRRPRKPAPRGTLRGGPGGGASGPERATKVRQSTPRPRPTSVAHDVFPPRQRLRKEQPTGGASRCARPAGDPARRRHGPKGAVAPAEEEAGAAAEGGDDEEDKEKERRQRILDHGAGSRLRPNIGRQRNNPASAIAVLAATMRRAAEGCQAMACTDTHRTNYGA
ncbi:unnamed protein product [Prorocentrum cordatum]|uniref:Uncharacterized protein n=1 Tax=Prorocentrum cordatum TaxID=2364126 RepID=A0ABN9X9T7_9DINO|nr:unnamed protein product [Polarella glacialis]